MPFVAVAPYYDTKIRLAIWMNAHRMPKSCHCKHNISRCLTEVISSWEMSSNFPSLAHFVFVIITNRFLQSTSCPLLAITTRNINLILMALAVCRKDKKLKRRASSQVIFAAQLSVVIVISSCLYFPFD